MKYFLLIFLLERNLQRGPNESPLWLRLKAKINNTKLGKLNLKSHIIWENIRNKHADKIIFYSYFNMKFYYLRMCLLSVKIVLYYKNLKYNTMKNNFF